MTFRFYGIDFELYIDRLTFWEVGVALGRTGVEVAVYMVAAGLEWRRTATIDRLDMGNTLATIIRPEQGQ